MYHKQIEPTAPNAPPFEGGADSQMRWAGQSYDRNWQNCSSRPTVAILCHLTWPAICYIFPRHQKIDVICIDHIRSQFVRAFCIDYILLYFAPSGL